MADHADGNGNGRVKALNMHSAVSVGLLIVIISGIVWVTQSQTTMQASIAALTSTVTKIESSVGALTTVTNDLKIEFAKLTAVAAERVRQEEAAVKRQKDAPH